jgi:hypothetical protein
VSSAPAISSTTQQCQRVLLVVNRRDANTLQIREARQRLEPLGARMLAAAIVLVDVNDPQGELDAKRRSLVLPVTGRLDGAAVHFDQVTDDRET